MEAATPGLCPANWTVTNQSDKFKELRQDVTLPPTSIQSNQNQNRTATKRASRVAATRGNRPKFKLLYPSNGTTSNKSAQLSQQQPTTEQLIKSVKRNEQRSLIKLKTTATGSQKKFLKLFSFLTLCAHFLFPSTPLLKQSIISTISCDLLSIQRTGERSTGSGIAVQSLIDLTMQRPKRRLTRRLAPGDDDQANLSSSLSSFTANKIAALSSKLEQWLQCQRLHLLKAESSVANSSLDSATSTISPPTGRGQDTSETPLAWCEPHFDGHLCWPRTEASRQISLACPKINHRPAKPSNNNNDGAPKESVIENNNNNENRQLAQSISAANQQADERPKNTDPSKLARRRCNKVASSNDQASVQWQERADYSNCLDPASVLFDPTDKLVNLNSPIDRKLFDSLTEQLERIEVSIDPYLEPDLLEQWQVCIGEIVRQHEQRRQREEDDLSETKERQCPIIFDGWRCWPATRAGQVAYVSCPSNQPGFSAERKAHKICTLEADWYRHPMTNRYWSNYTTCVDTVDLAFRTKILNLYVIGNLISLIALTMSLIIFVSFKSLKCTRVTIHKNLFLSFITNNLMWVVWYTYVVNDADLLQSNPIGCRFWHILLHYFLVSNYFWMFCEGLYLHTILVVAFVSEDKILKWFYLLGWLTPIPITLAYAYNRWYDEYYTNFCWMEESPHNVILMAPIGFSLLLNLVFLINIVRVLVTKLRANNSPDTHQTRKAVRATLILIPLLGLHYMLTPFRPEAKSEWEMIYEIIAAVCTSFQGLCVALLFCFCNGEVLSAIRKKLKDSCLQRESSKQRTMRSRSNTAVSNVFNYSSNNYNNNSSNYNNHSLLQSRKLNEQTTCQRVFDMSPQSSVGGLISTSNSSSNNNNHHHHHLIATVPITVVSNEANGASQSSRSSLITTVTGSPTWDQQQLNKRPVAEILIDETACSGEETIKLLQQPRIGTNEKNKLGPSVKESVESPIRIS